MFYYVICVCLGYGNFEVLVELMFCLYVVIQGELSMKLCKLIINWKYGVVYIRDISYLGEM